MDASRDLVAAFDTHYTKMKSIAGWLSDAEAFTLFAAAASLPERAVAVEIGSYVGKSSVCIAGGLAPKRGSTLHCIDPFDDTHIRLYTSERDRLKMSSLRDRFIANTWEYDNIVAHAGFSTKVAWPGWLIDMLFIDGDHSYDAVLADVNRWVPLLKPGGILAMHDVSPPWSNPRDTDPIRVVCDLGLGIPACGWTGAMVVETLFIAKRTEEPWKRLESSR